MIKTALRVIAPAMLLFCYGMPASAIPIPPPGHLTQAKNLHAVRTKQGYDISGELQSSSTCMDTRFSPLRMPDTYAAEQYKRVGSGPICGFIVTWKVTKFSVTETSVPAYVHVRIAGGRIMNVRVRP